MSLIRKPSKTEKLCTFAQAGEILGLGENTIRDRKCGTENLTHVPIPDSKLKRLVFSEVVALRDAWINAAKTKNRRRNLELVA